MHKHIQHMHRFKVWRRRVWLIVAKANKQMKMCTHSPFVSVGTQSGLCSSGKNCVQFINLIFAYLNSVHDMHVNMAKHK